ncbi:hypothetical protein FIBSPDRAFT_901471 [Athelia psychrophila]|uniref:Uncharacterized protein n=1 Tax=Athelia psychrophila TaxID=1759441 RepID=A0A165X3D5_9AGAM|nr:hypothetical protein FIBSPDRAFT_903760 [Fibularhizoctonia sp. CBS 109695]KZP08155.1 hypothetical protein FIBSPDRAFT_901471 [Fibularhizoctonia sp. CBS 109695]
MSSNFVTAVSNHHVSAGVEVTNVNGNIFNTTIYIVDSEHINRLASIFAEARALELMARANRNPREHVPVAAPAVPTSGTGGIEETRKTKLLRRLGAYTRGIRRTWRQAWGMSPHELEAADEIGLSEMRSNVAVA